MTPDPVLLVVRGASGLIDLDRLPGPADVLRQAIAALSLDRRLTGCKHVLDGETDIRACAQHPAAGVLCRPCYRAHVQRHSRAVEFTCDECGAYADPIVGLIEILDPAPGTKVRDTRGWTRLLDVPVLLGGIGACHPCAQSAASVTRAATDQGGPS